MPEPTTPDKTKTGESMKDYYQKLKIDDLSSDWNYASLEEVKKNYFQNTNKNKNLITIKGKVENTLLVKENIPLKIAFLKLDTNLYEGTKIELEILYPRIQKNGFLVVDNYFNYLGVRQAVNEYFKPNLLILNRMTNKIIVNKK